jgi:hydrogenase expression/formation protein HypC
MCLAVPGEVLAVDRSVIPVMGTVSFAGVEKQVCLEWLPDIQVGEYVIVHVGFALSKVDKDEALETLNMLREMGDLADDEETPPVRPS